MIVSVTILTEAAPSRCPVELSAERVRSVVTENIRVAWRFLRRLGMSEADADDAAQEVMLVVARKIELIREGSERAFVLSTAFRVAASMRRLDARRREATDEHLEQLVDPLPPPDAITEQKLALELLDQMLGKMTLELRAVFVAAEFEGLSVTEIAQALDIPRGTAASRLRTAREDFNARVERYEAQARNLRGAR